MTNAIHKFTLNESEDLVFSKKEYRDKEYFDIRVWFESKKDGERYPSKKGLTIRMDLLDELQKGVDQIREAESVLSEK